MAKKPSREELESRLRTAERDNGLLLQAMNDLAANQVTWLKHPVMEDDGWYRIGYSRLNLPSGGILYITFNRDGQSPSTTIQYLDDALAEFRFSPGSAWSQMFSGRLRWSLSNA